MPSQAGARERHTSTVSAPSSPDHPETSSNVIKVGMLALHLKTVTPHPFWAALSTRWHYSAIKYIENYEHRAHNGFGVQTKPAPQFIPQAERTQYFIKITYSRLSWGSFLIRNLAKYGFVFSVLVLCLTSAYRTWQIVSS